MPETPRKPETILMTGSTGFIGTALLPHLQKRAIRLIAWDHTQDLRQKNIWKQVVKEADSFILLAAQTSATYANLYPLRDASINLLPVINLISECQKTGKRPDIIFAGTATQVGLTTGYPLDEKVKDLPRTVYDINKLAAEKYLQYYSLEMGGRAVTLRLTNVYGPGPLRRQDRGIVNRMIKKALQGKPLTIYSKGSEVRDYIFVSDVVSAFIKALTNLNKLSGRYYLIGSGKGHSIKEMVGIIRVETGKRTGQKSKIIHISPPIKPLSIESRSFVANSKAFQKASGWKPKIDLHEGITKTIDFYLGS